MIYTKTYSNGLRLILDKNNKSVMAVNILFGVGSQNETEDEEGFSHFIEHLSFKSSKKYTTEEILDKMAFLGADFNAYTSKITTKYVFKCLKENFENCFEIYADMLLHPKYLLDEVERERNVVIEEMKKYEDDPTEIMYQATMRNYFNGTSLAHDVLGSEKIIASVTPERLLEFRSKYYRPENSIISVAGNINFDTLDEIVTKYIVSEFNYTAQPILANSEKIIPNIVNKYDIIARDDSQANVCLHIKSVPQSSKLKYVSSLYSSILGNSQSSRLYKKIREELGLVYSIYAYSDIGLRSGEILIVFGTRPKNINKAIYEIKNIINEFAQNGATEEELERAKNWKKSCIEYASETNSDLAETNAIMSYIENKILKHSSRKAKYDKVTLEQVNNFAKKIASEKTFNIVAVGKDINIDDLKQY